MLRKQGVQNQLHSQGKIEEKLACWVGDSPHPEGQDEEENM